MTNQTTKLTNEEIITAHIEAGLPLINHQYLYCLMTCEQVKELERAVLSDPCLTHRTSDMLEHYYNSGINNPTLLKYLTEYYSLGDIWYNTGDGELAYVLTTYAVEVLKSRWPAVERYISAKSYKDYWSL